jgi:hypothetical protein
MRRATRLVPNELPKLVTRLYRLPSIATFRSGPRIFNGTQPTKLCIRGFSLTPYSLKEGFANQAKELNQKGLDKQEDGFNSQIDNAIGDAKELQARTPWHREGSDKPPVKRMRSASAMTKGMYLDYA